MAIDDLKDELEREKKSRLIFAKFAAELEKENDELQKKIEKLQKELDLKNCGLNYDD